MGILNITPDSFSDGGMYMSTKNAISQFKRLFDEGADLIDIGAQSTRPGSIEVGADIEKKRLLPILNEIRSVNSEAIISVDTFHSKVASAALEAGANWVNDISGGRRDQDLLKVVANANCPYVLTHSRGDSQTMDSLTNYQDVVDDVIDALLRRTEIAVEMGVKSTKIIWDPGIGFAKTTEQNIELLKNIELIKKQGFPLLIGPSKKRFIGEILNEQNIDRRIWGTLAVVCNIAMKNVDIIRVHDVMPAKHVIRMSNCISL